MSVRDLIEAFERILPCPPSPFPEEGSDAWYRWKATLFNAKCSGPPYRIVEMPEYLPLPPPVSFGTVPDTPIKIIRVECDSRGRGVRVIR